MESLFVQGLAAGDVDRTADGAAAVKVGPNAALDLDFIGGRKKIGEIDKENSVGVGVVEWNAVEADGGSAHVEAAEKEVGVADAVAAVVVGVETWGLFQEDRHVLRPVTAFDLFAADVGHGHRCLTNGGPESGDLDLAPEYGWFGLETELARVPDVGEVEVEGLMTCRGHSETHGKRRRFGDVEKEKAVFIGRGLDLQPTRGRQEHRAGDGLLAEFVYEAAVNLRGGDGARKHRENERCESQSKQKHAGTPLIKGSETRGGRTRHDRQQLQFPPPA